MTKLYQNRHWILNKLFKWMFERFGWNQENGNGCKGERNKALYNCFLYSEVQGLLKNIHPNNNKSSFCCIPCGMYVAIEHQGKLDLQRHYLWKFDILNAKRTQGSDPHFISKSSYVKRQVSIAKVTGLLAKHNLRLATGPLSKSIFPDSHIAKEHSTLVAKEKRLFYHQHLHIWK